MPPPPLKVWNFPVNPPTPLTLTPAQAEAIVWGLQDALTPGVFDESNDTFEFERAVPPDPPGPATGRSVWDRILDDLD